MIDNAQAFVSVNHQVRGMKVAVTEHAWTGGEFGGDIVELGF